MVVAAGCRANRAGLRAAAEPDEGLAVRVLRDLDPSGLGPACRAKEDLDAWSARLACKVVGKVCFRPLAWPFILRELPVGLAAVPFYPLSYGLIWKFKFYFANDY